MNNMSFNRGELVDIVIGGHSFRGRVDGPNVLGMVDILLDSGEFLSFRPDRIIRVNRGYQVGDIIEHSRVTGRITEVGPKTIKVEILTVNERPAPAGSVRTWKRSVLQYAKVNQ